MTLAVQSPSEIAARIDLPFSLVSLGLVGDISAQLYVAQGQVQWHKHVDEDELFLVHEGAIHLETERGNSVLYAEEALLVPKGVGHRSSSALRSVVILFRQQVIPDRKNGRRHYLVTGGEPPLAKARLSHMVTDESPPFAPVVAATLESYALSIFLVREFGPSELAPAGGTLLYAIRGAIGVELKSGGALLEQGHLTILPSGTAYQLHAARPATAVKFEHE